MKIKEFLQTTPVFTTGDVQRLASSKESTETLLRRAVASGEVQRIRRGLYASKTGKYYGEATEPFSVIRTLDPNAVVSYHAALAAHGLAHNVSFVYAFRTSAAKSPFSFEGMRYVPYAKDVTVRTQVLHGAAYGSVLATTREQTLLDCLSRPSRAGGVEEIVRSLSTIPYVNFTELEEILAGAPGVLVARCGWLLEQKKEQWRVPDDLLDKLESHLGTGSYRFGHMQQHAEGWSNRWRLCLPNTTEEVESWVWR